MMIILADRSQVRDAGFGLPIHGVAPQTWTRKASGKSRHCRGSDSPNLGRAGSIKRCDVFQSTPGRVGEEHRVNAAVRQLVEYHRFTRLTVSSLYSE